MRLLLVTLALALTSFQEPEPYPGQREHAVPPDGWMCEHQNYTLTVPVDHACNCERSCDGETGQVIEESQCLVYCHASHCSCPVSNMQACRSH